MEHLLALVLLSSLLKSLQSAGAPLGWPIDEVFWPSGNQFFPEFPTDVQQVDAINGGAEFLDHLYAVQKTFLISQCQGTSTKFSDVIIIYQI